MKISSLAGLISLSLSILACGESTSSTGNSETQASSSSYAVIPCDSVGKNEFCDQRFGQAYKFITYGTQVWMAENLNAGSVVPGEGYNDNQSDDSRLEKYCYNDSTPLCISMGGLYQWYEAVGLSSGCLGSYGVQSKECPDLLPSTGNVQGACPDGWHIPREAEWGTLIKTLGGRDGSGSPVGSKVKVYTGEFNAQRWDDGLYNDSNSAGFSAYPTGFRQSNGGFDRRFQSTAFWSIGFSNEPFTRGLGDDRASFLGNMGTPETGNNIRCLRDDPATQSSSSATEGISYGNLTDSRDNQSYKTIQTGTQTWMAENLNFEPTTGVSTCFNDLDKNCEIYGRLYTWTTAMGIDGIYDSTQWKGDSSGWKGLCPEGWKIPSMDDWMKLRSFADRFYDGALNQNAAFSLKSDSLWNDTNGSGFPEMSIGFNGLPAGYWGEMLLFQNLGSATAWWSSEQDIINSYGLMHDGLKTALALSLALGDDQFMIDDFDKKDGRSIRCIKAK